jgi:hypothetical protein
VSQLPHVAEPRHFCGCQASPGDATGFHRPITNGFSFLVTSTHQQLKWRCTVF